MKSPFVLINGAFIPAEQAVLNVSDLAIQRGYGIFDFFRTVKGRPVFLDDHLDRFEHSASRMRLSIGKDRNQLKSLLLELIGKNDFADSGVRITVTGGYSPDAYSIATPNLVVTQRPLTINADWVAHGIRLVSHPHQRQFPDVKTIDYLMAVWLQPFVQEHQADDVLYHHDGIVSECPRSNFFIVTRNEKIVTPADHILKGIVRKHVLQLAPARFAAEEGSVRLEDIRQAREAFVTSTTKGVMPVVQFDGHPIADGQPGKITRWLGEQFNAQLASCLG